MSTGYYQGGRDLSDLYEMYNRSDNRYSQRDIKMTSLSGYDYEVNKSGIGNFVAYSPTYSSGWENYIVDPTTHVYAQGGEEFLYKKLAPANSVPVLGQMSTLTHYVTPQVYLEADMPVSKESVTVTYYYMRFDVEDIGSNSSVLNIWKLDNQDPTVMSFPLSEDNLVVHRSGLPCNIIVSLVGGGGAGLAVPADKQLSVSPPSLPFYSGGGGGTAFALLRAALPDVDSSGNYKHGGYILVVGHGGLHDGSSPTVRYGGSTILEYYSKYVNKNNPVISHPRLNSAAWLVLAQGGGSGAYRDEVVEGADSSGEGGSVGATSSIQVSPYSDYVRPICTKTYIPDNVSFSYDNYVWGFNGMSGKCESKDIDLLAGIDYYGKHDDKEYDLYGYVTNSEAVDVKYPGAFSVQRITNAPCTLNTGNLNSVGITQNYYWPSGGSSWLGLDGLGRGNGASYLITSAIETELSYWDFKTATWGGGGLVGPASDTEEYSKIKAVYSNFDACFNGGPGRIMFYW